MKYLLSLPSVAPLSSEKAAALVERIAEHLGCESEDVAVLPPGVTLQAFDVGPKPEAGPEPESEPQAGPEPRRKRGPKKHRHEPKHEPEPAPEPDAITDGSDS